MAGQPASHRSDPLSGPGSRSAGFAIDPQLITGLPRLVNDLSFNIVNEDHPSQCENDTPMSEPNPVIHSSPATLPQLLALLPKRRARPKPSHQEEEYEEVRSMSTCIDEQANRGTKVKKHRTERLAKGNESDHLHGEELEVGFSGFSHPCLPHFPIFVGTYRRICGSVMTGCRTTHK